MGASSIQTFVSKTITQSVSLWIIVIILIVIVVDQTAPTVLSTSHLFDHCIHDVFLLLLLPDAVLRLVF